MMPKRNSGMETSSPKASVRGERSWRSRQESSRASSRASTDCGSPSRLSLMLLGAPAPRCSRAPPKQRSRPVQPPNSPICAPSRSRPLPLPIDRIMILREKCESVLGCDLMTSDRGSSIVSSHPDLSIDLSSVNNSDHETDSESDIPMHSLPKYEIPNRMHWSGNSSSSSALSTPQRYFPSKSSQGSRASHPNPTNRVISLSNNSSASRYPSTYSRNSMYSESHSGHSRRSADLICVYVDTVNNTELAKYFRPCQRCQKPCCDCLNQSDSGRIYEENSIHCSPNCKECAKSSQVKPNTPKTYLENHQEHDSNTVKSTLSIRSSSMLERMAKGSEDSRDSATCACPLTPELKLNEAENHVCVICKDPFCKCPQNAEGSQNCFRNRRHSDYSPPSKRRQYLEEVEQPIPARALTDTAGDSGNSPQLAEGSQNCFRNRRHSDYSPPSKQRQYLEEVEQPIPARALTDTAGDSGNSPQIAEGSQNCFRNRRHSDYSPPSKQRLYLEEVEQPMPARALTDTAGDSGNSTLQLDDSERSDNGILSRRHVSLSIMQLSTAAQCARILADSLESVLQLAKEELSSEKSTSGILQVDSNTSGLQSALETLNLNYSIKDETENVEGKAKTKLLVNLDDPSWSDTSVEAEGNTITEDVMVKVHDNAEEAIAVPDLSHELSGFVENLPSPLFISTNNCIDPPGFPLITDTFRLT